MRFSPVDPVALPRQLAAAVDRAAGPARLAVGVDGDDAVGTADLVGAVAEALRSTGREAHVVSTRWWWRPAALRLEFGRTDEQSLAAGWVDEAGLIREVLRPFASGLDAGGGWILPRLRDPDTDRSLRVERRPVRPDAVLLVHGPLLTAAALTFDARVVLRVADRTLQRVLPPDRQWWRPVLARHSAQDRTEAGALAVLAYDHPRSPAVAWRQVPGSVDTPVAVFDRGRPPR